MAAYLVVEPDWKGTDLETRRAFGRAVQPVIAGYGGRFLTQVGQPESVEALEGEWRPEYLTIIEFPDAESVRRMVASPEYCAAAAIRRATAAVFKMVVVEGAA